MDVHEMVCDEFKDGICMKTGISCCKIQEKSTENEVVCSPKEKPNKYERIQTGKQKEKRRAINYPFIGYGLYLSWNSFVRNQEKKQIEYGLTPNLQYWKRIYLTKQRKLAKRCTAKKIRNETRDAKRTKDVDELHCPQQGSYRKYFDYDWCIW